MWSPWRMLAPFAEEGAEMTIDYESLYPSFRYDRPADGVLQTGRTA
jgi:hypothetical protein